MISDPLVHGIAHPEKRSGFPGVKGMNQNYDFHNLDTPVYTYSLYLSEWLLRSYLKLRTQCKIGFNDLANHVSCKISHYFYLKARNAGKFQLIRFLLIRNTCL